MTFKELERIAKMMQVMNDRTDIDFVDIDFNVEKSIGYQRLWICIAKGCISETTTLMLHISRFEGDPISISMEISRRDEDFNKTVVCEKETEMDTISTASKLMESSIQAFIA